MKLIFAVLIAKIVLTLFCWCLPLLLFPPAWFLRLGVPLPEPVIFARLLGAAYLALIVGYSFGLGEIKRGIFPNQAVWMGIVSNGLGCGLLAFSGMMGYWTRWTDRGQVFMWFSALATLCITGLLVWSKITHSKADIQKKTREEHV